MLKVTLIFDVADKKFKTEWSADAFVTETLLSGLGRSYLRWGEVDQGDTFPEIENKDAEDQKEALALLDKLITYTKSLTPTEFKEREIKMQIDKITFDPKDYK